ncbi:MAG: hypothetical protein AAB874_06515 [Patescibacteria group bacterium]
MKPEDIRKSIIQNYGPDKLWISLRGSPPGLHSKWNIEDAVIPSLVNLRQLKLKGDNYLQGMIINFFKSLGGMRPTRDQSLKLRSMAQQVVDEFPDDTLIF